MTPNPRTVSRRLLTRKEFIPATTLNTLAATWIQFMVKDGSATAPGISPAPSSLRWNPTTYRRSPNW